MDLALFSMFTQDFGLVTAKPDMSSRVEFGGFGKMTKDEYDTCNRETLFVPDHVHTPETHTREMRLVIIEDPDGEELDPVNIAEAEEEEEAGVDDAHMRNGEE
jgi:hypothetical protein